MPQSRASGVIRFGVFEVEPQTGILRKHGVRIRLQEQPFRVLLALLEKRGDMVTREELHQKVWEGPAFGDFDHSLNIAINKIREALRDSPETPRFVETLPSRGYRFIAPVEGAPTPAAPEPLSAPPPPERPPGKRRWWMWAAAVPILAATVWLLAPQREQELPMIPVPLTSYPGIENSSDFSPDGTQVAFQWDGEKQDNFDIYVKVIGADPPLRLTRDPAVDWSPAWSPDGRQIAFLRKLDTEHSVIYVVPPVGGPERKVAEVRIGNLPPYSLELSAGRQLSWSPDGKWLATIDRGPPDQSPGVFLIPVEQGEKRRLTTVRTSGFDLAPDFSPDGRSLAFIRCEAGYTACELFLLDLDSNYAKMDPRRLTKEATAMTGLSWTEDGKQLVFSGFGNPADNTLWRVPPSGMARAQPLAFAGEKAHSPANSRRGRRLAYSRGVTDYDLWQIDARGSLKRLVASTFHEISPQFSPDGRKIAFMSQRTGASQIWIANQDGLDAQQLTYGSLYSGTPRWAPDGRSIAFDSLGADGRWDIYVIDAAGGQPRRMTRQPGDNYVPSWSNDAKWIYFGSTRGGRDEIMRMPASGGEPTQITAKGAHTAFESPDGAAIYYTKTDSVERPDALWRIPVGGGTEHQVLKSVFKRAFAVVDDGIYYVPGPGPGGTTSLQFLDFTSGKSRALAQIEGHLSMGLAVSPDRKRFVISRSVQWGSDLMLVENFR